MKKLAGLVIVLAVLILGGYYGMGVLTERTIKKNIEAINQTNGLLADVDEYHRGWFCSDAKIKWRLHVPERIVKDADGNSQTVAAQDYQMEMPIKIHHGPIIYSDNQLRFGVGYAQTVFALPKQYNQQFDDQFSSESVKPQLDLSIFVNYLLHSEIEAALPHFKLIGKNGTGVFDWNGMNSTLSISSNKDHIDGDVVIDGMSFTKEESKITLSKVTAEYDLHQTIAGIYLGDANFNMPSFDVTDKKETVFRVKDFSLGSNSDIENNLFSTHFNLGLKSVEANKKTYGPGELEITLRNLDADTLGKINQQTATMQNGTEAERQQAMMALLPELPKLFSKGAELEISKCTLKIPEGSIDGNLLVSLPKGDSSNPFELIQKIQGHAKLKAPAALVKQLMQQSVLQQMAKQPELQQVLVQQLQEGSATAGDSSQPPLTQEQIATMQADKQIATIEQNGLVVASGSDYVIEIGLDQGKFAINGKPFDPAMLKF